MAFFAPRVRVAFVCLGLLSAALTAGACTGDAASPGATSPLEASVSEAGAPEGSTSGDDSGDPGDADGPDVFAACSADRPADGAFPPDVASVLEGKCQTCHGSPLKNRAPFALLTYANTQADDTLSPYSGVPIWQVMHAVIQPNNVPHMPYGNAPQLTSTQMQTLDGWLLGCALPASDADADGSVEVAPEPATDAAADAHGP
jgi:hypothetical protein